MFSMIYVYLDHLIFIYTYKVLEVTAIFGSYLNYTKLEIINFIFLWWILFPFIVF